MPPLLSVNDLHIAFGAQEAVRGVSFDLQPGEVLGIVGESGSGKSATALSLLQLLPRPAGRITRGSALFQAGAGPAVDLFALPEAQMPAYRGRHLAMIFQEPMSSLNPVFRCGWQVQEAILQHQSISAAAAKAQVLDLFREVQLPDPERIYNSYPHQVSGGQKQRVMIAMAMSCQPSVLIADEPTTALDVTVQQRILELIKAQRDKGRAIIFISHDLGVVAELADRVLVMYRGEVVESGRCADIFRQARHPYTRSLLACRPPLHERWERLPTVSDFMAQPGEAQVWQAKVLDNKHLQARQQIIDQQRPLLEVEDLRVHFPQRRDWLGRPTAFTKAVDGVSFEVKAGETLGLVGESGCGKSTLGRAILRLQAADGGRVRFDGQDVMAAEGEALRQLRRQMQIIFQDPYASLNPRMRIGEAIMEPMQVHGLQPNKAQRREAALHLLDMVGLEAKHFGRYPHEFSGGQRQRICIARALSVAPRFLICDESVSALDVSVQAQVLNLLMDLRERLGFTAIFISHDLSVVKFISDRLLVMRAGQIVERGWAESVYAHPQSPYTQRLIAAIPKGLPA